MFSDLATIREAVKDALTPLLPSSWKFVAALEGTIKSRTPVVYIEFTNLDTTIAGEPLPRGSVAAQFNLIVTDPKTDTDKAEDDVDAHLLKFVQALDPLDDIYWTTAAKDRLPDGPLAWQLTAFAIANTTTEE